MLYEFELTKLKTLIPLSILNLNMRLLVPTVSFSHIMSLITTEHDKLIWRQERPTLYGYIDQDHEFIQLKYCMYFFTSLHKVMSLAYARRWQYVVNNDDRARIKLCEQNRSSLFANRASQSDKTTYDFYRMRNIALYTSTQNSNPFPMLEFLH